jgi:hypothetical protein
VTLPEKSREYPCPQHALRRALTVGNDFVERKCLF